MPNPLSITKNDFSKDSLDSASAINPNSFSNRLILATCELVEFSKLSPGEQRDSRGSLRQMIGELINRVKEDPNLIFSAFIEQHLDGSIINTLVEKLCETRNPGQARKLLKSLGASTEELGRSHDKDRYIKCAEKIADSYGSSKNSIISLLGKFNSDNNPIILKDLIFSKPLESEYTPLESILYDPNKIGNGEYFSSIRILPPLSEKFSPLLHSGSDILLSDPRVQESIRNSLNSSLAKKIIASIGEVHSLDEAKELLLTQITDPRVISIADPKGVLRALIRNEAGDIKPLISEAAGFLLENMDIVEKASTYIKLGKIAESNKR